MGGGWVSHDPIRHKDLIWGGEFGQEGSILFAVDVDSGDIVEQYWIGAREFSVTVQPDESGKIWIYNYHGLYQPGNILQSWSPETRKVISHGFPPLSGQRFVSALWGDDDKLYLGTHPFGHLVSFDPEHDQWADHGCQAPAPIIPDQQIWCHPQFMNEEGEIICSIARTRPGHTIGYNTKTNKTRGLAQAPERPKEKANGRQIEVDIYANAYSVGGEHKTFDYQPQVATDICGLNKGTDGRIYGSTIISMHIFSFDPASRQLSDLGRVGWGSGEVYDVIGYNGKVYMGSYTGAYWGVYDPKEPWRPMSAVGGEDEQANPRTFGRLGQDMNRPFEYTVGPDACIYIACRANYGLPGGGLGSFNPATEEFRVFRDDKQSVQCITADHRYVYGGTSKSGGRGCIETTKEGKLFIFDTKSHTRLYACIPVMNAVAVTSLAISRTTGLVYGSTSTGHLFSFDVDERQIVDTWRLRSMGTPLMGVPETYGIIHLTGGSDGHIYGVSRTDVFKIDVIMKCIVYLDKPPIPDLYQIVEGAPGIFYIGARGHLLEYHLKGTPHFR